MRSSKLKQSLQLRNIWFLDDGVGEARRPTNCGISRKENDLEMDFSELFLLRHSIFSLNENSCMLSVRSHNKTKKKKNHAEKQIIVNTLKCLDAMKMVRNLCYLDVYMVG